MTTAPAQPHAEALSLLPVPRLVLLSDLQVRGVTCVWCGVHLKPGDVHDLGPRIRPGGGAQWFPRGCTRCVRNEARHVLNVHGADCQCTPGRSECATRAALRRLITEGCRR
ncbi:hypothetical protein ACIHFC_22495 [Streptomyces sp. NPDC052013]|uniref:hypothetical protein n=1 Tax=Streptomyces sp. NPDC052013 TaxID=3365679 RepID=UPI0037D3233D